MFFSRSLIVLGMGMFLNAANADGVTYNTQDAIHAQQFREQVGGTEECLHEAHTLHLRDGIRDRKLLTNLSLQMCGQSLRWFMGDVLGRPKKEVDAFLVVLSGQQLNRVLAESR